MASLLDIGLLKHFGPIFTFLLVFVLVYAILTKAKIFGKEKESLIAMIAISLAVITMFFGPAVELIEAVAPWFVFLLVFTFFILLIVMAFGVTGEDIAEIMKKDRVITWVIISFSIAIFLLGVSQVYGPALAGEDNETGEFNQTVKDIIFHPKILGVLFLLIMASFAVKLLSSTA